MIVLAFIVIAAAALLLTDAALRSLDDNLFDEEPDE